MGIKHVAVKAHGDKGLASEWNDDHEIDGDVECEQHQHKEHVIENRTAWPAGPVKGQIIYRTDTDELYVWNGVSWQAVMGIHDHSVDVEGGQLDFTSCFDATTKIRYYSVPPEDFITYSPAVEVWDGYGGGSIRNGTGGNQTIAVPIHLPHGAVVTAAVFYAQGGTTWDLRRSPINAAAPMVTMGQAAPNVEDNLINSPIIDNQNYKYYAVIRDVPHNNLVYGGRITYTIDADNQG